MTDLAASAIHFDGVGATAGSADEAARVLAARLNHWLSDHAQSRILQLRIQSTSSAANVELTAILAFSDEPGAEAGTAVAEARAVMEAEEIVADASEPERREGAP